MAERSRPCCSPDLHKGFGIPAQESPHTGFSTLVKDMVCQRCGGSGIQRVADQRFRTCLSCLGQGKVMDESPEGRTSPLTPAEGSLSVEISAAVASSSAAR